MSTTTLAPVATALTNQQEIEMSLTGTDVADLAPDGLPAQSVEERRGIWMAVAAYSAWGILPIYFKALHTVAPLEMLANRIVWSLFFMLGVITWRRGWHSMRAALTNRRAIVIYAVAATLLAVNWYVYIWAVNADHILDASLGYFINPLMNVVLGVVLLGERLRSGQWLAIAVAASGVVYLTWTLGQLPWVALVLATTFATYGVLKKKAPLPAEQGMMLETATLFIPALMTLVWLDWGGNGALLSGNWFTVGLLLLSGPLTVIPLMLFGSAAKVVPLSTLGILQYLSPTGQFLVGVFIFGETVTPQRLLGFAIIWSALLIFWLEGWRNRRARAALRVAQAV